jgi:hypothetical protein
LPLKALSWHEGIPAAVVQQLGNLQGLTALTLHSVKNALRNAQEGVMIAQLAALLRQLTALQCLHLRGDTCAAHRSNWQSEDGLEESSAIRELLQAICSLRQLIAVEVELYVRLPDAAVTQLNGSLPQLLCGPVAQGCSFCVVHNQRSDTAVLRVDACHVEWNCSYTCL